MTTVTRGHFSLRTRTAQVVVLLLVLITTIGGVGRAQTTPPDHVRTRALELLRLARAASASASGRLKEEGLAAIASALAMAGNLDEARAITRRIADRESRRVAYQGMMLAAGRENTTSAVSTTLGLLRESGEPHDQTLESHITVLSLVGYVDVARELTTHMRDPARREHALGTVGAALAGKGRLSEAQAIASSLSDPQKRGSLLFRMTVVLAEVGRVSDALAVAATIPERVRRDVALQNAADNLARRGQPNAALPLASRIEDTTTRDRAYRGIVVAFAEAGQVKEAADALKLISDSKIRDGVLSDLGGKRGASSPDLLATLAGGSAPGSALAQVVEALAFRGQLTSALSVAQSITERQWRGRALGAVAVSLAQAGRAQEAREVARQAVELGAAERPQSEPVMDSRIRHLLVLSGRAREAQEAVMRIPDDLSRQVDLADLIGAVAASGDIPEAKRLLVNVRDPKVRAFALVRIVRAQAWGAPADAEATAALARAAAESSAPSRIPEGYSHASFEWSRHALLMDVVRALARPGLALQARRTAMSFRRQGDRFRGLVAAVETLAESGHTEQALATAQYAARVAESTTRRAVGDELVLEIVGALTLKKRLDEARILALGIQNSRLRAVAQEAVARALAEAGRITEAQALSARGPAASGSASAALIEQLIAGRHFDDAEAVARRITHPGYRAKALATVAGGLVAPPELFPKR